MKQRKLLVGLITVTLLMAILASFSCTGPPGEQGSPGPQGLPGPAGGPPGPYLNPLNIALLRWYDINRAENVFNAGNVPMGICFDGASIWVADSGDDTVTKLRASDGQTIGICGVGNNPVDICFDGTNVWVAHSADPTVIKL